MSSYHGITTSLSLRIAPECRHKSSSDHKLLRTASVDFFSLQSWIESLCKMTQLNISFSTADSRGLNNPQKFRERGKTGFTPWPCLGLV